MSALPSREPILVIDIGGTQVKFGYSADGRPHAFRRLFPTAALRCPQPVEALAGMVGEVTRDSGLDPSAIVATVPGFLDRDMDRVLFAGNVLELNGRCLASELAALTGRPVVLERDAVLTLMGEVAGGAARGCDAVLGIFFGTGVGAAYVEGGRPFRGAGWALEIGHAPFRREGRELPGRRQRDCLEAYVSGVALATIAERHGEAVGEAFRAATRKPELARELDDFVHDQAFAVGMAVAMLSPRTVVLGGGILDMPDFPKARLAELVAANAPFEETGQLIDLRWAELGWLATLHGAPAAAGPA